MQGTAEIITEDIRLLQKIVNPFPLSDLEK